MRIARQCLALAFSAACAACAPTIVAHKAPLPPGPERVIDAHVHLAFSGQVDPDTKVLESRAGLADEMRRSHVVGAVAMEHSYRPYEDVPELNVIHCLGLDGEFTEESIDAALSSGKYRCIKIYLGYVHRFAYDAAYEPAYRQAEKHGVPVVFHTGDTDSAKAKLKYADPLTIDEVAVDHPKVTFVMAHAGNPWIESAAEVCYKNPNVYMDGSAFLIGEIEKLPQAQIDEYVVRPLRFVFGYMGNPKKLMFGTDWPLVHIAPYLEAFKRAIPPEHWPAVFYDNAARVYGFDRSK